ncbi:protein RRP5 homolog [Cephus cinctus]|uniref:rRNA biogenesis protein RRP5 n=1 Tax=Cephus cinctus TaxID=211228 RepID=A0AAJ7BL98_CEPCN|nr:protein RRP5 homolog [Cephus cinctus]
MTLQNFPRGGKKQKIKQPTDLLFGKKDKAVHKRKKLNSKKINSKASVEPSNIVATTAECLTFNALTQGMIVLGRIQESTQYGATIALPGRICGKLEVTNVSQAYTKLLENVVNSEDVENLDFKALPEIYKPGDYVVCSIKEVNLNEKWMVSLSFEPEMVNQNLDPAHLVKGSKLACSISSIEEHGYAVDTGINNLRGFLSLKDIEEGKEYYVGQQILCAVKEAKTSDSTTVVKLSTISKHVTSLVALQQQPLDTLIPGTKMTLEVKRVLSNGLQVVFNGGSIGYINQTYLNGPLSSYSEDMKVHGTLLYIMPTVKYAYFSLLSNDPEVDKLNIGDIVEKARVVNRESNGILLNLPNNLRGFVSLKKTEVNFDKIRKVFAPKTIHKCKLLAYNSLDRIYICTMQRHLLQQKYVSISNTKPGDLLNVKINKVDIQSGFVTVSVDKISGFVPPEHISDLGPKEISKLKVGDTIKAKVFKLDKETNKITFTLKQSLVQSNLPVLHNFEEAEVGKKHHGVVVQITTQGLLIRLIGDLKGWVPAQSLDSETACKNWNFSFGQVVPIKIVQINQDEKKLLFEVVTKGKASVLNLSIGEMVEGTVIDSSPEGVQVRIIKKNQESSEAAFLPAGHMAPSSEIGSLLAARYVPGDTISGMVFSTKPNLILTRTLVPQEKLTNFEKLKIGHCLPCSIAEISDVAVKVILPIKDMSNFGTIPCNEVSGIDSLSIHQIIFGKITFINKEEKLITLTAALHNVWSDNVRQNIDMTTAVDVLSLYLNKVVELSKQTYYESSAISKVVLGQRVSGTVEKVTDYGLVLKLDNNLNGTVRKENYSKKVNVGDKVTGSVIWVNYIHEIVEIVLLPHIINAISTKQKKLSTIPTDTQLRGEIVLVTKWFVLAVLKGHGKGTLVALPSRRHLNDVDPALSTYVVGGKIKCFIVLNVNESDILPICILKSALEPRKEILSPEVNSKKKNSLKRQISVSEQPAASKKLKTEESKKVNEEQSNKKTKKVKESNVSEEINKSRKTKKEKKQEQLLNQVDIENTTRKKKKLKRNNSIECETGVDNEIVEEVSTRTIRFTNPQKNDIVIPECGFIWDTTPDPTLALGEDSSSSEEEAVAEPKTKKKKLSATERRELERQKEREIRQREEALASSQTPNSVDQFDRLVLSSPDSSLIWLQYMAYHLQATEIEKARAVARRAIKTINFREENEKLNVWQAWLNLESRFGSPESLNDVFQEAVRTNDAFKIYMHMLTVHADAGRQVELEKIVTTAIGKFKQNPQVWIECGAALLKIGLKEKSRQTMQRALQSLPANQHVDLMVKFAQLENKFGDKERSQTLFEQVLSSYPKRVDVWSSYVDSLIKSGDIDIARKILERAVVQTLPARKMKSLFKKFVSFEEQHGTPERVSHVQQLAVNYVENQCRIKISI